MTAHKPFKMNKPTSKASKPKHKNWERIRRFREGHDAGCKALLPEDIHLAGGYFAKKPRAKTNGVFHSLAVKMSREERIVDDALFLLNHGHAGDLDEAIERAFKNNPEPEYKLAPE